MYEERLERAERRRLQGNALFTEGRHQEALGKYAMVGISPSLVVLSCIILFHPAETVFELFCVYLLSSG